MLKTIARWALALFFIAAGANHFIMPEIYLGMMPRWVPAPEAANAISGVAEILGGLGVLVPATRRWAGWGLLALLIAVFPANVHVALEGKMPGTSLSPTALWLRLPFQVLFAGWVWWTTLSRARDERTRSSG